MFKYFSVLFSVLLGLIVCGGCTKSYVTDTSDARAEFFSGRFVQSAEKLEKKAHTEGDEQVLYLLERATALFHAQAYDESIKDFLLADKLSEIMDYTSLSAEAASLLVSDELKHYRTEEYEYVMISQYLALSYLFKRAYEDALVECRRVNHKLYRMISEGKRKYVLSPMARYLSALIYEDQGSFDDAYIDYKEVAKLTSELPLLKEDLYRMAIKSGNRQDLGRISDDYGLSADDEKNIRTHLKDAEVVVVIENGKSPEKHPNPDFPALPTFVKRYSPASKVKLELIGQGEISAENFNFESQTVYDVEDAVYRNYNDKYGPLLAKKIAGLVAKKVVADQVGKQTDPVVGFFLFWGMHAADQADTRAWLTLPKDFQIARIKVSKAGDYKLKVTPLSMDGSQVGAISSVQEKIFQVEPGKKQFISVRVM